MKITLMATLSSAFGGAAGQLTKVSNPEGIRKYKLEPKNRNLENTETEAEFSMNSKDSMSLDLAPKVPVNAVELSMDYGPDSGGKAGAFESVMSGRNNTGKSGKGSKSGHGKCSLLSCGEEVSDSTVGELAYPSMCDGYNNYDGTGAVWYKLKGINGMITLDMCNEDTVFDTILQVIAINDECSVTSPFSMQCVGTADDGCGYEGPSKFEFEAEEDVVYWVMVYGFKTGQEGNYRLSVTCNPGTTSVTGKYSNAKEVGEANQWKKQQHKTKEDKGLRV